MVDSDHGFHVKSSSTSLKAAFLILIALRPAKEYHRVTSAPTYTMPRVNVPKSKIGKKRG